jgi:hypothetical protein
MINTAAIGKKKYIRRNVICDINRYNRNNRKNQHKITNADIIINECICLTIELPIFIKNNWLLYQSSFIKIYTSFISISELSS